MTSNEPNASLEMPTYFLTLRELSKIARQSHQKLMAEFDQTDLYVLPGGKFGLPFNIIRDFLTKRGVNYDFKVIAHMNLRGGIGKTTSAVSLATRAAQYGYKTCILDLDPQASASLTFGLEAGERDLLFYDVWQQPERSLANALKKVDDHLYLLPSSLDNSLLDAALQRPGDQKKAVTRSCDVLKQQGFDLVVIDCPPALGTAVISSVCAAHDLVIPLANDAFSFRGLDLTLSEIKEICNAFNLDEPTIHTLLVKVDKRESLTKQAITRLQTDYKSYQMPMHIRTSTVFAKVLDEGKTIFARSTQDMAHQDYDHYSRYLLNINFGKT